MEDCHGGRGALKIRGGDTTTERWGLGATGEESFLLISTHLRRKAGKISLQDDELFLSSNL